MRIYLEFLTTCEARHAPSPMIRAKPGRHPGFDSWEKSPSLCLRQIFDSWEQSFAEQVSHWPLVSSKANQSPDDGRKANMLWLCHDPSFARMSWRLCRHDVGFTHTIVCCLIRPMLGYHVGNVTMINLIELYNINEDNEKFSIIYTANNKLFYLKKIHSLGR
jgi:hypothetical protein